MIENEESKEPNEEVIETPEVIDDGAGAEIVNPVEPMTPEQKDDLLDEFLDMIDIGEEFAIERAKFLKKWAQFMKDHNDELAQDPEIIEANQKALKLNEKLGM
jgi:hypothetical protein